MPTTLTSSTRLDANRPPSGTDASTGLSCLSYRSLLVAPMSDDELRALHQAAQTRNHAEAVTGMMICDGVRVFQWLEGPAQGVARVWNSIRHDPRHTSIEVLGDQPTQMRFFGEWDMRLSSRSALDSDAGAFDLPSMLIDSPTPTIDARANELARLLIAADPNPASQWVAQRHARACSIDLWFASLFEPTARSLGDMWQADDCSDFDVTLGLDRLQMCLRDLDAGFVPTCKPGMPTVLLAPLPGESHMLGAALDAELLWRAGWQTQVEFPSTHGALDAMLAEMRFDVLDLSLSLAFRREHWLPRMADAIARARRASRNPDLIVVVRGRVFGEPGDAALDVGADARCASALEVESTLLRALGQRRLPAG